MSFETAFAYFERDACKGIISDDLGNIEIICVSVTALVESKGPVRHLGRQAGNLRILLGDIGRTGAYGPTHFISLSSTGACEGLTCEEV